MRAFLRCLPIVLLAWLVCPAAALAQQERHVAGPSALDRLLADQVRQDEADRQVIREVLQHDEVRQVAQQAGLDVARAEAAVATLSGAELQELAAHARQVNETLSGGASTVVISTTTIVIVLLLVLLIVLAID